MWLATSSYLAAAVGRVGLALGLPAILVAVILLSLTRPAVAEDVGAAVTSCDPLAVAIAATPAPPQTLRQYANGLRLMGAVPGSADIVLLGDSLLEQWPEAAAQDSFRGDSVFNFAAGGDRTQHVLWRLTAPGLRSLSPKLVVIMIGTNNLGSADPACAVAAGILRIVDDVAALWPTADVLVFPVLPRGFLFSDYTDRIGEVDRLLNLGISQRPSTVRLVRPPDLLTCGIRAARPAGTIAPDVKALLPACGYFSADWLHLRPAAYPLLGAAVMSAWTRLRSAR